MDNLGIEKDAFPLGPKNTNVHPLEEALKTYKERKENGMYKMASRTFGLGFALHLKHERAATSCPQIGHIGLLKRHDAMHQSLTGQDLDFDFADILAVEREFNLPSHHVMDNFQTHPLCPK
ncbi:UNVERIFIED_CONTAM: hypothetical protein RMT77_007873 [Armadillidium vulgare]|nr:hypothetical protein Avbf_00663 [Armadillidium vulgare]